jgi:hypothetical protein
LSRALLALLLVMGFLAACEESPLGSEAASECSPLADPGASITSEALTSDGHYVVVVGAASAMRVFYGIPAHLVEGVIKSTKPGCAFEIAFEVQGRAYVATFSPDPVRCMVTSELVSGDPNAGPVAKTPLTVLRVAGVAPDAGDAGDAGDAAASSASLSFFCP